MTPFLRAIRAEFAKTLTTRMWWVLAAVMFGYIALLAGGLAALFAGIESGAISPDAAGTGGQGAPPLGSLPPLVYSFASSVGYVFPVLLGALSTTGEFRHQTLTPTFLANPRRGQVLGAKTVTLFLAGAGFGVVALLASVGVGALVIGAFGVDPLLGDSGTWALIGRTVLAMAMWAGVGVGLGVLVPSQVAAVVIVLAFTQFVEPLLRFASMFTEVTAGIGNYLPGAASDALVGASFFTIASPTGTSTAMLEWWQGGLVLLAYAVAATVGGYFVSWKRDVT
ncbi:ABC transporter permease [Cryobacterium sp. TMT1-21]|uniref:ABC transporter permease n=1 Tax=Cryobacterium shii TaxID=1259235 RepID=A0AAQ2C6R9_9MICO|nr:MULTISPECIES: ABC transporter permease [Cryobacterium]TFC47573.1 ABC transporter permease [Cryobacterium shii]TFC85052.1 ABC transporter permease [Cryobacterium sp. TmT2-59]TFD13907.1 ABC transporter permease [Cryobacterium sp. TMT1-21]TFD20066.1 ABC transporter permease [Cryobacterium sp. TMT4-10]TFD21922.1 ABC transporter permease [Cryobacterium sp. TMT2-23]